eukprot:m.510340 g.510340  ORF g.510340 m.510340 type:complete len:248 (+) comp57416_c0_seq6:96-839(+)
MWERRRIGRVCAAVACLACVGWIVASARHWLAEHVQVLPALVATLGPWGYPAFVLAHSCTVPLLIPIMITDVLAGVIFGFRAGFICAFFGAMIGCSLSFFIARNLLQQFFLQRALSFRHFQLINAVLARKGQTRRAIFLVILTRFSPLFPKPIFNYIFGISQAPFSVYFLGSCLGLVPHILLETYIGSLVHDFTDLNEQRPTWYVYLTIGFAFCGTMLVAYEANKLFKNMEGELDRTKQDAELVSIA